VFEKNCYGNPVTIVIEVTLNHEFLMSSPYTDSERVEAVELLPHVIDWLTRAFASNDKRI
jgi:hypothetical protein